MNSFWVATHYRDRGDSKDFAATMPEWYKGELDVWECWEVWVLWDWG